MRRPNYETDDAAFPHTAYQVTGYRGVAWHVYGHGVGRHRGAHR